MPAHSELAWMLGGTARMGWLNRMTQWKDKAGKNREGASVGLFTYPVLQAADVLLYKATHVPVGDDQKQHLELARDIATKFNQDFGVELFTLPEPFISPAAPRIMSLRDGSAKMSQVRSVGRIADQPDRRRRHDRAEAPQGEDRPRAAARRRSTALAERPEARNLVTIYAALADRDRADVLARIRRQGLRRSSSPRSPTSRSRRSARSATG